MLMHNAIGDELLQGK